MTLMTNTTSTETTTDAVGTPESVDCIVTRPSWNHEKDVTVNLRAGREQGLTIAETCRRVLSIRYGADVEFKIRFRPAFMG